MSEITPGSVTSTGPGGSVPMTDHGGAASPQPVVDDERFMRNVREALENGYDRCCAACGVGTAADDMDIHERACPEFREWR